MMLVLVFLDEIREHIEVIILVGVELVAINQDGPRGENETYRIPGRATDIPRETLVREVEAGQHPNHSTYTRDGETYVRAKPDSTTADNVNKP